MKALIFGFGVVLLSGCTGKLYTIVNPDLPEGQETKVEGVLVYRHMNVIELYNTTVLVDPVSGNQTATAATGGCLPNEQIKFSTRTDYGNPQIVMYRPALFETGKFSLALDKGALVSVNVESGIPDIVPEIAKLMPFFRAPRTEEGIVEKEGKPLCNAAARLVGVYKAPDIQPFDRLGR